MRVLVLWFCSAVFAGTTAQNVPPQQQADPTVERFYLRVESTPPDAVVYLDGKEQAAHTPVELPGLPKGKHVVRIALSGYHDHEREVVLDQHLKVVVTLAPDPSQTTQARPPTIVEPKPTGQLAVTSTPAGALVTTIDQDQKTTGWGNTPTTVTFPAPGRYTIRVALTRDNGSVTVERAVEIGTANQVMKIDLTAAVQIGPKK